MNRNLNPSSLASPSLLSKSSDMYHDKNDQKLRSAVKGLTGLSVCFALVTAMSFYSEDANAQAPTYYHGACQTFPPVTRQQARYFFYRQEITEPRQVTRYRTETETQHKETQVTEYQDETRTETRYRKITKFVPVVETDYRTRQVRKMVPHTETVIQKRQRQVTEMVEETGYRQQQVVIPKTIQETSMQERSRIVQTPVTQTIQQQVPVTTYQQQTTYRPQLVNNPTVVNQLHVQPGQQDRSRLRWLGSTNYIDPISGRQVYRRRGLYWTRNAQPSQAYVVPTVVPNYQVQQVPHTSLVPTTSYQTQSYDINSTVNRVVTEKVPVTVSRTVNEIVNKQVPYTVRRPVTRTITEDVPVQQTTMREEITEEQIPVQRTTMKRVEEEQPYQVQITRKVPVTKTVNNPRVVTRRVPYTETVMVKRLAHFRVTLDALGQRIAGTETEVDIYGNPIAKRVVTSPGANNGASTTPILPSSGTLTPIQNAGGTTSGKVASENSTLSPQSNQNAAAPKLKALRPVFSDSSNPFASGLLELKPIEPASGTKKVQEGKKETDRVGT